MTRPRVAFPLASLVLTSVLVAAPSSAFARDTSPTDTGHVWASVTAGTTHTCGIRLDHTLWCWGYNAAGDLGTGDTRDRRTPTQIGTADNWTGVDEGRFFTCGTRADHTLWCWGYNGIGELGLGDTMERLVPTQLAGDDWQQVATGAEEHACAVKTDHTLWCWGTNADGEGGNGGGPNQLVPTQVGSDTDWSSVGAGMQYTCAIKIDTSLWCFGRNDRGELGVGDPYDTHTYPTQVAPGSHWSSVALSRAFRTYNHTCGIQADGTLWCWGSNRYGQVGIGGTMNHAWSPVQIGLGQTWLDASAGTDQSCAVRSDHTLWCWGRNGHGQLGLGGLHRHATPRHVKGDFWGAVSAGSNYTMGVGTGSGLYGWGDESDWVLGNGQSDGTVTRPIRI